MAGAVLVGATAMGAPAVAAEGRADVSDGSWVDCGPNFCTEYYSKERTKKLLATVQELGETESKVAAVEALAIHGARMPIWVQVLMTGAELLPSDNVYEAVEDFEDVIDDAVDKDACLQHRVDDEGKHLGAWGYTGHSEYCFNE